MNRDRSEADCCERLGGGGEGLWGDDVSTAAQPYAYVAVSVTPNNGRLSRNVAAAVSVRRLVFYLIVRASRGRRIENMQLL